MTPQQGLGGGRPAPFAEERTARLCREGILGGAEPPSDVKVVLEDVAKEFATGRQRVLAVDGISLAIHGQEFACLLGPSGCGKSTVLNLVAGFERPTRGRVAVNGVPVTRPGPDRAVVFQEPALFPWLSVLDNITFGPKTQGQAAAAYGPLARQYVDLVGLTGFEHHHPAELSGGMKQRVGIARVLVLRPEVMLMDEPFGALDAQTRTLMQELLLRVWEQAHQTVLFITHDVEEALLLADTVYVMTARPGQIKRRLAVDLPRPRTIEETTSATFNALKREVLALIREESLKAARG